MAQAMGAKVGISYVAESTPGTTPGTPTMLELRTTNKNINAAKAILQSEERQSHRQIQDLRHGFNSVEGSIGVELGYNLFDDWLEAALGGTFESNTAGTPNDLLIGSTLKTFSVERRFPDISQFQVFRGVTVNNMTISIQPESIVTAQFDLVGMGFDALSASSLGSPTQAASTSPFDSFNGSLLEGGSSIGIVTGLDFTLNNGRSVQPRVGNKESITVFEGTAQITGTVTVYFEDASLFDKFVNETETSISVTLDTLDGSDSLTILIPRIKYTGATMDPGGEGPVILDLPFTALYDDTETSALKLTNSNN